MGWPGRISCLIAALLVPGCECGDGGQEGDAEIGSGGDAETSPDPSDESGESGVEAETEAGEDEGGDPSSGPGTVTMRRLNRTEYNNTIRDLLGEDLKPAKDFPGEDPSFGFDNIGDVLTISPLQLELFERSAEGLAKQALRIPILDPVRQHFEAEDAFQSVGAECCGGYWNIYSNGQVYTTVDLPASGEYEIIARAFGHQAGDELPHMVFEVQGQLVAEFDVEAEQDNPETFSHRLRLEAGARQIAVGFTNDFYDPDNMLDRNLLVDWFEVYGPFDVDDGVNKMRERIVTCDPADIGEQPCLEQISRNFAAKAFRRPPSNDEVQHLLGFLDIATAEGGDFESALQMVVQACLLSPHFLFRVELDDPEHQGPAALDPYELASRLSYFLWASMPDDELFARAEDGSLLSDDVLRSQAERMLADPKAESLIEDFAGQWLSIRALDDIFKDTASFPDFDDELRAAMRSERSLFFAELLDQNRPLAELLDADYSFVNPRLAEFYGVDGPDEGFEKTDLSTTARRGVLTQAGLLSVLAHPTSTSPVRRGKWVLEKLLCQPPPPPPGDIDIPELDPEEGKTMKEALERHRADPACAGCHQLMDPIGLGLEHFDAIGSFRQLDNGQAIDPSGSMGEGLDFADATELIDLLAQDERLPACAIKQMLTYALGRGPRDADEPYFEAIEDELSMRGFGMRDLVLEVIMSDLFRTREAG